MIITGIIRDIFPERRISDRFRYTEIWIQEPNVKFPQVWPLQVWNDDAKMLRYFNTGQLVNVHFAPIGRLTTSNGEEKCFINLRALKIEKLK